MSWLVETPAAVVNAHVLMLDRLTAEESMRGGLVAAMPRVLGGKRGEGLKRSWDQWRRLVRRGTPARQAGPADLSGMGIGVRIAPPRKAAPRD